MSSVSHKIALIFFVSVVMIAHADLTINTYEKISATQLNIAGRTLDGNAILTAQVGNSAFWATLDVENVSFSGAVSVGKGNVSPSYTAAVEQDGSIWASVGGLASTTLLQMSSDLTIEEAYENSWGGAGVEFSCNGSTFIDGNWSCFYNNALYQYQPPTMSHVVTNSFVWSGASNLQPKLYESKWLLLSSGEYAVYGNVNNYTTGGLFLMIISPDLSTVTNLWTFGANFLSNGQPMIEVEDVQGLLIIGGTTMSNDGFVASINLNDSNPIDISNFYTFPGGQYLITDLFTSGSSRFVLTTSSTVNYFSATAEDGISNLWSNKLTSSFGGFGIDGVVSQSEGNLVVIAVISKSEFLGIQGFIQLAEMTTAGEIASNQSVLTSASDALAFTQAVKWGSNGAPSTQYTKDYSMFEDYNTSFTFSSVAAPSATAIPTEPSSTASS